MDYSKLSNAEIDALCAEAIGEFTDHISLDSVIARRDNECGGAIKGPADSLDIFEDWEPSNDMLDFEDIKHEIERRRWGWKATSGYRDHNELRQYRFTVHCGFGSRAEVTNFAPTEARACCVAFLLAVEATKGER